MSTRRLAVSLVAAVAAATAVPLLVGSNASSAPAPAQCPSTPSYGYTIPEPVGPPAAISLEEGGVGNAVLGADRKLYYSEADISGDPLLVSPLGCLGGQATDAPAVVESNTGGRGFFVRAPNGVLYQRYAASSFPGPGYSSLGAFTPVNNALSTNGPAALQTPDGQWHLFVRGNNGALYHGFRQTSSLSSWRFESLGGQITGSPVAIVDGSRTLVAATTAAGSIYTIRGTNFAWGPWTKIVNQVTGNLPTQVKTKTPPSLVQNPFTGRITMYAADLNYGLFAISKSVNTGFTSRWNRIDTVLPSDARIAAATDGNNSIVYARFLDRSRNKVVLAYTQFIDGVDEWSDYFLAPYSCFNCHPEDTSPTSADKTVTTLGKVGRTMPKSKVVLKSNR